jgi:hypothetical protein
MGKDESPQMVRNPRGYPGAFALALKPNKAPRSPRKSFLYSPTLRSFECPQLRSSVSRNRV